MKRPVTVLLATAILAVSAPAFAAKKPAKKEPAPIAESPAVDTAQVLRETALKKEPFADTETVATLPAASAVTIITRQGAWTEVKAGDTRGWLRLLALRSGAVSTAKGDSGLGAAINVARAGASGNTVATGVRGLSKEQISNAVPNAAELAKMQGNAVDEPTARSFAAAAPATSTEVPFLESGDN